MKIDVKVPEVGESVQEALIAQWLRKDGETVAKDDILFVIETDKVTLEVTAPADGILKILVEEGKTVSVGTVVATIDAAAAEKGEERPAPPAAEPRETAAQAPAESDEKAAQAIEKPVEQPQAEQEPRAPAAPEPIPPPKEPPAGEKPVISSSVLLLAKEKGVDLSAVSPTGPGGRITEGDVLLFLEQGGAVSEPRKPAAPETAKPGTPAPAAEKTVRKPMSPIRLRIAERLLESRRNTAMLTTFNEIDMGRVQALRKQYGEEFRQKHGVRLGMMSFFIKASTAALKEIPVVNAFLDGKDIVYHNYYNIGVAIGAERGLVVPVIRDADGLGFAGLERAIVDFVEKISQNRLEISDLEGGTFTITNGGIYGSLLSTPILNPPQSAILGMHKIEDRPVALGGQVAIRPMMYVALSYDHRIIDGRDAVTFLRKIKDFVENPERLIMEL